MNGITELLKKYGTSLEETRKLMPELVESIERERAMRPPPLPITPQFFTAEEVRGMGLVTETGEPFEIEPGYRLKVTPPVNGQEPAISLITPEEWEITQAEEYISPEGQKFTRREFEAFFAPSRILYEEYQRTGGELDIESWAMLGAPLHPGLGPEQVFGRVFPEGDIEQLLASMVTEGMPEPERLRAEKAQTEFLQALWEIGRTKDTEALLRQLGATTEQIEEFFAPPGVVAEPIEAIQVTGEIPAFNTWAGEKGFTPESLADDLRARGVAEDLIPEMVEFSMSELRAIYEYEHDLGRWGTALGELDKIFISEPERIPEVAVVFARSLARLPKQVVSTILTAIQGQGGASVVDKDWADRFIEEAGEDIEKFRQDIAKQYPNSQLMTELASLSQNLGFSVTSMGAGLGVGIPIALAPIPGARIAAYGAGTAASGFVAYQMTTYQIMQQYLELKDAEKRKEFGIGLTQFDEDELKKEFHELAVKYGLWEAIPEAISNLAFFSLLTAPLSSMIGRTMAVKILSKIAGIYSEELLTETITQVGQAAIEVKAGLREEDISLIEAFWEIAPQTFLLTTVMAGAGQVIISSTQGIKKIKDSLTKEIGVNHPRYEEFVEKIETDVEDLVKTEPEVVEAVKPPAMPKVPAVPMVKVPPAISKKIAEVHNKTGGASFDIKGKNLAGMDAYAVGVQTEQAVFLPGEKITEADISDFISKNADLLSRPEYVIGTWFDEETGNSVLVVSALRPNIESAMELAKAEGQKEVFNLKTGERIRAFIISKFAEIDPIEFSAAIAKAPKQAFLTRYSLDELRQFRVFLSADKLVGYALKPDGDFVNFFNASGVKGAGQEALVQAIVNGATKLDAMNTTFLREYYEDAGFKVVGRDKWNEKYAPKDWDYKKWGRPDIIYMEYPKEGSRDANIIRESFGAARARRIHLGLRRPGPPGRMVPERGRPGRRAVPVEEPRAIERVVRVPAEAVVAPEVVKPPAKPIVTPELSDKRAGEVVTEPRPSVETTPESVPRLTVRHPKFAQSEEDIRLDLKQEFHDTFEGSVLGEPSASYLRDGDFDKFVELMPDVAELKLKALGKEIWANRDELIELRDFANTEIRRLEAQGLPERGLITAYRKEIADLKRDANFAEKLIEHIEKEPTRPLTIDEAASLGIALRKTRGGRLLPAIRRSGFYVTTDFVEYPSFEDVGYTSGRWMDTMTLFEAIDGGYATGMAQKDILYPTHITHLARGLFVDSYSYKVDKLCEQFGLEADKGLRKVTWDVVQQISKEEADFKTADLVRKPEIQQFISGYDRATQARLVEFSQGVRALLDDMIDKQNAVRAKRGQDSIAYREKYLAWVAESNIWSKLGWMRKTPADFFQKPPLPDYIKPDAPFNPRAMAREGGMRGYEMERDVRRLLKDYVNTAGKDIFNTNIIHNAKIHTATLRSMGYENSARLIEDWASESYAGVLSPFEKGARGVVPRPILRSIWFLRRQLTRAVFPLNWLWNVTIQPSSIAFTVSRYGVRNTIRGLAYLFDSETKAYVRGRYAWMIKSRRGGKMAYQDIGQQVSGNLWAEGRLIDKAEMLGNFMTNLIEEKLTGISIIAARHHGESLGFTGLDLDEFASKGGAKTQSMYNFEDLPGVLRSKTVGSLFPFQTFCFQAMNFVREIVGIRVFRAGAYHTISATSAEGKATIARRVKMAVEFLVTIMVINMVMDRAINRKPWRVTSFIPFYANLIAGMDAGNTWNWPLPVQYIAEFWESFNAVIKYDDWTKARKWAIRYHILGGTQINKMIDGAIALARGEVTDTRGKTLFEVNPDEWLRVIMMGPYASEEGREYVDRIKERRGGEWYEYTGFPLPERIDITDEIDKSVELLGKTDDEGAPHDFGDVVSDIRELRTSVGEKRFSLCVSPFVEGFRQAEASREEFEKLPPEKLEDMDVDEIADFIFPEADPEKEEITALWTNFNTLKTTQEKRDFIAAYIKEHSKELKGNEVANHYGLLQDMWTLEGKDLKAFLEKYPDLTRNWRDEWRKENPEDDARLSMWAYGGRIQTREAYALIVKWCDELGIDIKHLDAWLPPPEIADTYFDYNEKGEEFGWNSAECRLILATNEAFREWKGLDMPDSPIPALELKIKSRELDDQFDALETDEARKQFKLDNPEWWDDTRRIEAYENEASEDIVGKWVDRGNTIDEFGAGSSEAKVWLLDNPEVHEWALDQELLTDDGSDWNESVLRINVKWRELDDQYKGYGDKESEFYIEDDDERAAAREKLLADNEAYRKDCRRRDAYGDGFSEAQIENYVAYYELPTKGYRQERMLIENKDFGKAMHEIAGIDLPDPKKIPAVGWDETYEKWQADFEKLEGLADHESEYYIENVNQRAAARYKMRYDARGNPTEFGKAEKTLDAYSLFVPEDLIPSFVEWYTSPKLKRPADWKYDYWFEDDWFLMEHPRFYQTMLDLKIWLEPTDFSKVPTREVFNLYKTYLGIPQGVPQLNYRARHPDLDAWGILKFGWIPIGERGKKEPPKTPWEEAEEVKRFKELF